MRVTTFVLLFQICGPTRNARESRVRTAAWSPCRQIRASTVRCYRSVASAGDACPVDALRNRLRQISARWDTFFLYHLIERFWYYISTNKLVSPYYKFLHMSFRIAMRGRCDTKSWRPEQRWRGIMKNASSKPFPAIVTFGSSYIATQRQFAKHSRSLCSDMGTYDSFL